MEGFDSAGLDARHEAFRGIEKICRERLPKGIDFSAAGYGGQRPCNPPGLRGGAAKSGVHLTDLGRSLKPILDAMWTWGEEYKERNG